MSNNFVILFISCLSFVNLFESTFGSYCDSTSVTNQAFNLGTNVYLGQGTRAIWKFNPDIRRTIDRKLDLQTIFGENSFNWIDTAFTFVFNECQTNTRADSYCEATNKAKDLVIAIGRRKDSKASSRKYGYIAYHVSQDINGYGYGHELTHVNQTNIVWNLKDTDSFSGDFWLQISGDIYYESTVFIKSRNELIVSVFDTSTFSDSAYHLMSRKLEDNGLWSPKWTEIARTGFRGMFDIKGRVFGFDKKNNVFEFKWSDTNTVSFEPISDLKELMNCFGNSSLWNSNNETLPDLWDPLDNFTSMTTTSTTTAYIASTESAIISTTDGSVDEKEEENDIHVKTQTFNYETIEPEVVLLTNITESSTVAEPRMNHKLKDLSGGDQEDANDWSTLFVVAILVLIIVIVIALIIIVRNKSKSRVVYLNSKSDDSKSAEIPLNNNDKNIDSKDV